MKKLTVFVLVLMYALAMVGCDQNQNNRDYIFGSWEAEIEMSILGVSVAGYQLGTCIKGVVHSGNIVGFQQIVRIKNKVAFKGLSAVILFNPVK